ncbi:MAG: PaaI family thioesterase [Eubacterium sp.]|nr:PaaI family thioesterase [Eubacterium sp.]
MECIHTLEEIRQIFKEDRFATEAAGAVIEAADVRYARCSLQLGRVHMNAAGIVMGGAIFTLADFCMAVAANGYRASCDTVAIDGSISYLKPARGKMLIAEAHCVKAGRTLNYYQVMVKDELGTEAAVFYGKTFTR